ncbi:MAG: HEAT repeat domain-containing protein [Chloroflexi bacterium]|nr:HEAT repeat domain-containing protein [Chloroflexota bacterium]
MNSENNEQIINDRYRILSVLGKGGMGAVYLCEDVNSPGSRWAVKELQPAPFMEPGEQESCRIMFYREAEFLEKLSHPSIPKFKEHFTQDGRSYLVMEYIQGKTLEEILKNGPLPFSESRVVELGLSLCEVLKYLHSQKPPVLFRDLKPANIMMTPEGRLMLVDFGIARCFITEQRTDTFRMGTVGYASPEQYGGMGGTDARSDIYSLGALLHYLLTGRNPEVSAPFSFPPVRSLNSAVSGDMASVVEKCLAKEKPERFSSIRNVESELKDLKSPGTSSYRRTFGKTKKILTRPLVPVKTTTKMRVVSWGMIFLAVIAVFYLKTPHGHYKASSNRVSYSPQNRIPANFNQYAPPGSFPENPALQSPDGSVKKKVSPPKKLSRKEQKIVDLIDSLEGANPEKKNEIIRELIEIGKPAVPHLVEALKNKKWIDYNAVGEALARIGEPSIIPLIEMLRDEKTEGPGHAAFVLRKIGRPAVKPLLTSLNNRLKDLDEDGLTRVVAALRMNNYTHREESEDILIEALNDKNWKIRAVAAWALEYSYKTEIISEPLINALNDSVPEVRAAAAASLFTNNMNKREMDALIKAAGDEDHRVRREAVSSLGNSKNKRAVPYLVKALKDTDKNVRAAAVVGLRTTIDKTAVMPLVEVLNGKDYGVMSDAAEALGNIQDERAIPYIIKGLAHEDSAHSLDSETNMWIDVKTNALIEMGEKAVPYLSEGLKDENPEIRKKCALALVKLKDGRAVLPLIEALEKETDSEASVNEALALCFLRDERAIPVLVKAAKNIKNVSYEDKELAPGAALGAIGRPSLPYLKELMKDDNKNTRQAAIVGMEFIFKQQIISQKEYLHFLASALKDKESEIRFRTIRMLTRLGDKEAIGYLKPLLKDEQEYIRKLTADAIKALEEAGEEDKENRGYE